MNKGFMTELSGLMDEYDVSLEELKEDFSDFCRYRETMEEMRDEDLS